MTEEAKKKLYKARRTPESRKRMSEWSKEKWKEQEYRDKLIEHFKKRKHTAATKEKMRLAKLGKKQTPEHIENAKLTRIGKKLPPRSKEYREKMSKLKKGKSVHSEEYKKALSSAKINKPFNKNKPLKPVVQLDKAGLFLNEYSSIAEAERQTKVPNPNIVKCCKGKLKSAGGFIWKYK